MDNILTILVSVFCILIFVGITIWVFQKSMKRILLDREKLNQKELDHQKELHESIILAEESEKLRIASELHDHFGVNLSTLKVWVNRLTNCSDDERPGVVNKINELLIRNIEEVRDLSHQISPPMLEELGLVAVLGEIRDNLEGELKINISSKEKLPKFESWIEMQIYRICQEFIQNALKYSQSENLEISFRETPHYFSMLLQDNGVGFPENNNKVGLGIKTTISRLQAIGAKHKYRSSKKAGVSLIMVKELQ